MAGPTDAMLVPGLARIAVNCGRRKDDDQTADFTLQTYMADLRAYPADIALAVVNTWPDVSKWWPMWKELRDLMEDLMTERRLVVNEALERAGRPKLGIEDLYGGEVGSMVRAAARKLGIGQ